MHSQEKIDIYTEQLRDLHRQLRTMERTRKDLDEDIIRMTGELAKLDGDISEMKESIIPKHERFLLAYVVHPEETAVSIVNRMIEESDTF
jgi:hypothetical protein